MVARSIDAPPEAATDCGSTATLLGDAGPLGAVSSALRRRGIRSERGAGCSALRVTVARRGEGIRLAMLQPTGRLTTRVVATAETAATLIESLLRTDIAAPLMAARALDSPGSADGRAMARVPAFAPAGPLDAETVEDVAPPPAPPSRRFAPTVAMVGEAGVARGGAREYGAGLTSCVRVGAVCIGLAARLARASVARSPDLEGSQATVADGMLAADLAWPIGRATLRPGAAIGLGWVGVRGSQLDGRASWNEIGFRAEARLALDWTLGRGLAVELAAGAGAGASTIMDVALTPSGRMFRSLESGPARTVHGGLGLRYGSGPF
jgi:hypothetical protein